MFKLMACRMEELPGGYKDAVNELTAQRYVKDVLHLGEYLCSLGMNPESEEFHLAYNARAGEARERLGTYDKKHSYVSAIFLETDEMPIAIATMRMTRGHRKDVRLPEMIGNPQSSIPTHTLFKNFCYSGVNGLRAEDVSESEVLECHRLAVIGEEQAARVIRAGLTTKADLQALLSCAFDELIVSTYRRDITEPARFPAWIFNVRPKLARALRAGKGIDMIPLFMNGVEPTEQAKAPDSVFAPHFARWMPELQKVLPGAEQLGIRDAIRSVYQRGTEALENCAISLPYAAVCDEVLESSITGMEKRLNSQTTYSLIREVRHEG